MKSKNRLTRRLRKKLSRRIVTVSGGLVNLSFGNMISARLDPKEARAMLKARTFYPVGRADIGPKSCSDGMTFEVTFEYRN